MDKARKRRRALLAKVAAASKSQREQLQKQYLGSSMVRLSALVDAAGRLEYHQRLTIPDYESLASGLSLFEPISEDVFIYLKAKSSGGHRYFCDFGVRHRAAQALVADLLRVQFKPRPYQFDVAGRGIPKAVQRIRALFDKGFVFGQRYDVRRFYDSFKHEALVTTLRLPTDLIEHIVIGQHYVVKAGKQEVIPKDKAILDYYMDFVGHAGLPQGSACSPLIAQFFMSKLAFKLPSGAVVLNYADDFLVLSQTPEKGEKAINALQAALAAVTVGDFELLEKSGSSKGFEFLGHHFTEGAAGDLEVSINGANQMKFHAEMSWKLASLEKVADGKASNSALKEWQLLDALLKFAQYILSWKNSFSHANNVLEFEAYAWAEFTAFCEKVSIDPTPLIAMAKKGKVTDVELYPSF